MPRKSKYANDEERMKAVREYRKRYYQAHRELLVERTRQWRAEHTHKTIDTAIDKKE